MHRNERERVRDSRKNIDIEISLSNDFSRNKLNITLKQPFNSTSLFVPGGENYAKHVITMADWSQSDKIVLYKAMIAAYNYAFFDKEASISAKEVFSKSARFLVEWLNVTHIEN
ncbi:hypothetical protein ACPV40_08515 [Vibrio alfacsensis]|uniref:hypothetical protein n=1 Tax=Vibrio alfacsensis TaxID=1074311 RepID=UPI0040695C87